MRGPSGKLVQTLLEAPSVSDLVDRGLASIAEELRVGLVVLYRATERGLEGTSPRTMPRLLELYAAQYAASCPFQLVKRAHNPDVAVVSDMVESTALRRSEAYHDFYRTHRIERQLTARLSAIPHGEIGCEGVVFTRSRSEPPFGEAEVEALSLLRPLLASVLQRNRLLESMRRVRRSVSVLGAMVSAMDPSPVAVFDRDAELVWSSPAAAPMLDRIVADPSLHRPLRAAVRGVLSGHDAAAIAPSVEVSLGARRGWLLRAQLDHSGDPYVIVRFDEEAEPIDAMLEGARRFGLSPAERVVLGVLLEGKSNREIARTVHISTDTVRSHLKHIYAKLGVHTRAEAIVAVRDASRHRS